MKTLEEYGIGRPSTYASIISTLQDREYVLLDKKRFTPTDVGIVVNKFLTEHFDKYVDYEFTVNLELDLDEIAADTKEWVHLKNFWQDFNQQISDKENIDRAAITQEDINESCPNVVKHYFQDWVAEENLLVVLDIQIVITHVMLMKKMVRMNHRSSFMIKKLTKMYCY